MHTETITGWDGEAVVVRSTSSCEHCTIRGARDAYVQGRIEADEFERRVELAQEIDAFL